MSNRVYGLILVSILLSIFLTILPIPFWSVWFRPLWICLTLIYWVVETPQRVGLMTAWVVGIFLDILNGTLIGEHALALTITTYLAAKMERRFRIIPVWLQTFYVLIFLSCYQSIFFIVQGLIGAPIEDTRFWLSPIISSLLWPWWSILLRKCQYKLALA